jgi:hypothetical protein
MMLRHCVLRAVRGNAGGCHLADYLLHGRDDHIKKDTTVVGHGTSGITAQDTLLSHNSEGAQIRHRLLNRFIFS